MNGQRTLTLANGLSLSYVRRGDGPPPSLVLVPGPTDSWRTFEPVLAAMPESVDVVAVSPRGHGDSEKPESGYGTRDFAGDLAEVVDLLELTRPVVVGHSGAALVARRFALDNPGTVGGLVLEASPLALRGDKGLEEFVASAAPELHDPLDPDFVRGFVGITTAPVPESFLDAMVAEGLKVPARVWREMFGRLLDDEPDTAELAALDAPVLLVWGDQDTLVGRDQQEALRASLPNAELLEYAGVGHTPHWEVPERFAQDIVAFADEFGRRGAS